MNEKILSILRIGLLVISFVFGVLFYMNIIPMENPEAITYLSYIFFGLAVLLAILFPIFFMFKNPKNAKNVFIGIGILGVLFVISYLLAKGDNTSLTMTKLGTTATVSKLVGTGLILTYILAALAIVALAVSSITKLFK